MTLACTCFRKGRTTSNPHSLLNSITMYYSMHFNPKCRPLLCTLWWKWEEWWLWVATLMFTSLWSEIKSTNVLRVHSIDMAHIYTWPKCRIAQNCHPSQFCHHVPVAYIWVLHCLQPVHAGRPERSDSFGVIYLSDNLVITDPEVKRMKFFEGCIWNSIFGCKG